MKIQLLLYLHTQFTSINITNIKLYFQSKCKFYSNSNTSIYLLGELQLHITIIITTPIMHKVIRVHFGPNNAHSNRVVHFGPRTFYSTHIHNPQVTVFVMSMLIHQMEQKYLHHEAQQRSGLISRVSSNDLSQSNQKARS